MASERKKGRKEGREEEEKEKEKEGRKIKLFQFHNFETFIAS